MSLWHACEVAGPLFLVSLVQGPPMLVLLNQKNSSDFLFPLSPDTKMQLVTQQKFIFIKSSSSIIQGLFINNLDELQGLYDKLQALLPL